jgi:hypothetical protein
MGPALALLGGAAVATALARPAQVAAPPGGGTGPDGLVSLGNRGPAATETHVLVSHHHFADGGTATVDGTRQWARDHGVRIAAVVGGWLAGHLGAIAYRGRHRRDGGPG